MSEVTVTPFLWFDDQAQEAGEFYRSVFAGAGKTASVSEGTSTPKVMSVDVELGGLKLVLFNGGPHFKFTEAISLFVQCDGQEEIDYFWKALVEGGSESQCGWLKDRYGLSWQIVPRNMPELLKKPGAMQAMFGMKKLVIAELEAAG